ncbi:MAG: murein biosynthesis integral membrane protein MurJ [Planctomycetota bacterium]|jgi:putative peptidoglycan lipid II flippase
MIRGFRQIAFLTVISRVFGMVRDVAYAHFFGRGVLMDIWTIAFMIPNLSRRIFGEGAASSSLIPIYSEELKNNPDTSADLARTAATVIFAVLAVIVVLGELGIWWYYNSHVLIPETQLKLSLIALMLPYACLICTVAVLGGVLNAHRHFAMPAAAPIVLNIFIIGSMCVGAWLFKLPNETLVFVVAIGILFAGVTQMLMQMIPLARCGVVVRPAWKVKTEAFKKIMILMGPMILGLTVTQLNTLADILIANWLSGSEDRGAFFMWFGREVSYPVWVGSVSSLYFSQRLYQFPLGVLGISLATAIFPVLSAAAADKDEPLLSKTILNGFQLAFFVALPATAGLILVARPLTAVLFEHGQFGAEDTTQVRWVLIFYSVGLCGYFLQQLITRAFYSVKDSKWPARTAVIAVGVNVTLNLTLIWPLGVKGLALATALCSYLQVVILWLVLRKKFNLSVSAQNRVIFLKSLVGTVVMSTFGAICLFVLSKLPQSRSFELLRLAVLVAVCAGVYALAARLLGNKMLGLLIKARKKAKNP